MKAEREINYCSICGNKKEVQRTNYYYGIKCECHSPEHFEIVWHCKDCEPKEPEKTKITLTRKQLEHYHTSQMKLPNWDDIKEEFLVKFDKEISNGSFNGMMLIKFIDYLNDKYPNNSKQHILKEKGDE